MFLSLMTELNNESFRIPDGPKTVSLMLRESLSWRTMIPVAVISFETEAILRIWDGSIAVSRPSSAHPYPFA